MDCRRYYTGSQVGVTARPLFCLCACVKAGGKVEHGVVLLPVAKCSVCPKALPFQKHCNMLGKTQRHVGTHLATWPLGAVLCSSSSMCASAGGLRGCATTSCAACMCIRPHVSADDGMLALKLVLTASFSCVLCCAVVCCAGLQRQMLPVSTRLERVMPSWHCAGSLLLCSR